MIRVVRSTVIDAPVAAVWEILRDFNGHDRWHPIVRRSFLEESKRTDQVGCVRNFDLQDGANVRERLLTLSDRDRRFRYTIVGADIPLHDYVAEVELKPVTDGDRTFWRWSSTFNTPPGQERELAALVATEVYEAGFTAVRERVESRSGGERRTWEAAPAASAVGQATGIAIAGTAIVVDRHGGAEELRSQPAEAPPPGPSQVRLRQTAIGVNYIDVYCRTGYFDLLEPPGVPGLEAAGVVVDVGTNVGHLEPGRRVAYACPPLGAYTTVRTMDAGLVIPLPDHIDDETAAAGLLKGVTAEFLLHRVHAVAPGETVLVYAPAGGVGRILCQWANRLGATVIGATSTDEKARVARAAGAHHVIVPGEKSLEEQVRDLTDDRGADVIYDAVGRDSFAHSVAALAVRGHLVSFGQASGDIGPRDISMLAGCSATLSRPNYVHYTDTPEKFGAAAERLFDAIERRIVTVEIGQRFALENAAEAHRALENRATTGSTVLIPAEQGEAET
ncbi:MAG: zinc-binding dehydrogenase [Rhodospirillaceae bacterium]|nr:zinc-binding dehydrogenase [Rhodospirillaceae bacterium]